MFKTFAEFLSRVNESNDGNTIPALLMIMNRLEAIRRQSQTSHWNITGSDFVSLHELLDDLYKFSQECIDKTAERCLALDNQLLMTIECDYAPIKTKEKQTNLETVIGILNTEDIAGLMGSLDSVSENMVQEFIIELDKFKWKFESSK